MAEFSKCVNHQQPGSCGTLHARFLHVFTTNDD